jgi:flagellar biosynthesis protein FliQ
VDLARTVSLAQHALVLALSVAAPALLASALVGLAIGLVAAPLRLGDPALTAAPRLAVVALVVALSAAWGAGAVAQFARHVWASIPAWVA